MKKFWYWLIGVKPAEKKVLEKVQVKGKFKKKSAGRAKKASKEGVKMPNYLQYKKMMAVFDYDDSDIESWITVNGNHIPIKKGQTKEEAVKSFVEKKQGKSGSGESSATHGSGEYKKQNKGDTTNKIKLKDKDGNEHWVDIASIKDDPDTLPSVGRYKEYLNKITKLTGMTIESAREKYGQYTEGQWQDLFAAKKDTATAPKESEKDLKKWDKKVTKYHDEEEKAEAQFKKLRSSFGEHYDKLYNSQYLDDKYNYLLGEWDKRIKDPEFKKQVQKFVEARGDFISSDREVKAYMLALQDQENATQAAKPAQAKNPDSPLVSAVAKALNTTPADAESEIEGAAQHIADLMASNDLRNGDVEETLRGLGVEPDYAEEFMQWASSPKKKSKAPKVKWVDAKKWNDPRSDPFYALYN